MHKEAIFTLGPMIDIICIGIMPRLGNVNYIFKLVMQITLNT